MKTKHGVVFSGFIALLLVMTECHAQRFGIAFDEPARAESLAETGDNWPGAWTSTGATLAVGGDFNTGGSESFKVVRVVGDRKLAVYTTQFRGGSRANSTCKDGQVLSDNSNPENLAEGAAVPRDKLCAKSYGIASVRQDSGRDMQLMLVSPNNNTDGYRSLTLLWSKNEGLDWTKAWTAKKGMIHGSFMTTGLPGHTGTGFRDVEIRGETKKDWWVFFTLVELAPRDPNSLSMQGGPTGRVYLCKLQREYLLRRLVRCYNGRGKKWVANVMNAPGALNGVPVFESDKGVSWSGASLSYLPRQKIYMLITEHTDTFAGRFFVGSAKHPTGPYREVISTNNLADCVGGRGSKAFFMQHEPRLSAIEHKISGREVFMFTGVGGDDTRATFPAHVRPWSEARGDRC